MLVTDRPVTAATRPFAEDMELASAAGRGDPAAQRELVNRTMDAIRRAVGYLLCAGADAEDAAQEAAIQVLKAVRGYRGECPLERFAMRIAVRTSMRERRKRRKDERQADSMEHAGEAHSQIEAEADLRRIRIRLAKLLGKLKPERRIAMVLHHVEGYGIEEIADITGAPLNTVRDRLRVGRKQLKKRILADPVLRDWAKTRFEQ